MDTTLTSFIWIWITLILVVNLFGIVGLFIGADGTWQALQEVKEIYSPFNVMNWLLELLILSWRTPFWQGDFGNAQGGPSTPVGGRAHRTLRGRDLATVSFSGDTQ